MLDKYEALIVVNASDESTVWAALEAVERGVELTGNYRPKHGTVRVSASYDDSHRKFHRVSAETIAELRAVLRERGVSAKDVDSHRSRIDQGTCVFYGEIDPERLEYTIRARLETDSRSDTKRELDILVEQLEQNGFKPLVSSIKFVHGDGIDPRIEIEQAIKDSGFPEVLGRLTDKIMGWAPPADVARPPERSSTGPVEAAHAATPARVDAEAAQVTGTASRDALSTQQLNEPRPPWWRRGKAVWAWVGGIVGATIATVAGSYIWAVWHPFSP